jgi:hypothetical protein
MKKITIKCIEGYQAVARSGFFGVRYHPCVFYPTCSEYAKLSIEKHGINKGLRLAVKRITRCHPWQKETTDLVL